MCLIFVNARNSWSKWWAIKDFDQRQPDWNWLHWVTGGYIVTFTVSNRSDESWLREICEGQLVLVNFRLLFQFQIHELFLSLQCITVSLIFHESWIQVGIKWHYTHVKEQIRISGKGFFSMFCCEWWVLPFVA